MTVNSGRSTTATLDRTTVNDVSARPRSLVNRYVDGDTEFEIVDVVGDAAEHAVDELVALHRGLFPDYEFVAAEIVADAGAPPGRDSLIVHQWLVRCAGTPAGLMLFDSNVARRVAVIHFLGIERPYRALRLDGERLATWMCHRVRDTLAAELAEHEPFAVPLGVFGESSDRLVRRWLGAGFRSVDLNYAEPVAGRHWQASDDRSMRPMNLLWLPMHGADDTSFGLGYAGAAAFLIDHYALPLDHPTVVAATGDHRTRRGARR
jgi:hypothetical protein